MLHQDRFVQPSIGSQLVSPSPQRNSPKKFEKDGNFNFLDDDNAFLMMGDENRNQVRPRALGRDLIISVNHYSSSGPFSPLSRLPSWSPLEPLPEIESGDDMGGRMPPEGAEEGKMEEEVRRMSDDEKEVDIEKDVLLVDDDDEDDAELDWGDSEEEFEFSYRSQSSAFSMDSSEIGMHTSLWDQTSQEHAEKNQSSPKGEAEPRRESLEGTEAPENPLSDSENENGSELADVLESVWTLQDRERFKAQEMEKHQVQLTMYRRLALIRWVRTLQSRVQEQQNRLQSSFDIILTHRKELLRMGATTAAAQ